MTISIDRSRLDGSTQCVIRFSNVGDDQPFLSEGCGALKHEAKTRLRYVESGLEACLNQKNWGASWHHGLG